MIRTEVRSARFTIWARIAIVAMCILGLLAVGRMSVFAADVHVAGLVIDYGDGRISYAWVPFTEDEISGIELLERSGLDLVTVGFGGMGDAVCQIDDTGCPVGECRKRLCQTSDPESPFWRYSRQVAPGEWSFVATGVSMSTVRDGDIDAWSWTGTDAELPSITMNEVANLAGADPSKPADADDISQPAFRTEGETADDTADMANNVRNMVIGTVVVLGVAGMAIWRSRHIVERER